MALAYLQAPLADRLRAHGHRTARSAALLIVGIVVAGAHSRDAAADSDPCRTSCSHWSHELPAYVARLQALVRPEPPVAATSFIGDAESPARPIQRCRRRRLRLAGRAFWLRCGPAARRWSSFFSLLVMMPVVTFYLICRLARHGATALDSWMPRQHRTVDRARLAREIDAAITGFVRGQSRRLPDPRRRTMPIALSLVGLQFRPADRRRPPAAHLRALYRFDDRAADRR